MSKKQYKIQGHFSGHVYAKAKTLRGARAQRRKVAKQQWITESFLDIVDPMGKVIL